MEHAIGTRITLEVVEIEGYGCTGCFFDTLAGCTEHKNWRCGCTGRTDHKDIIYKEIKED